ncbi:MAG: ABC transporter ATP-binding protein [Candidatus Coatesbacteria bacterium]|nr:ABC transporter ATP-binding protein [Candidatus Coatesbacteria bacterium]
MIELKGINFSYSANRIFSNLNLEIKESCICSLVGRSGIGKSTFLYLIGGLLKPESGEVVVLGKNLDKENDISLSNYRNTTVGFIFQHFHLIDTLTVKENILIPHLFSRKAAGKEAALERLDMLVRELKIEDLVDRYPDSLSGGERQRTAIARALLNNPQILLADEPTGNLDSDSTEKILNILHAWQKDETSKSGRLLLMVTHDKNIAGKADRKLELSEDGLRDIDG